MEEEEEEEEKREMTQRRRERERRRRSEERRREKMQRRREERREEEGGEEGGGGRGGGNGTIRGGPAHIHGLGEGDKDVGCKLPLHGPDIAEVKVPAQQVGSTKGRGQEGAWPMISL